MRTVGQTSIPCPIEASPPEAVPRADETFFYHSVDLGDLGVVEGQWDLREQVDLYLGGVDFKGKSVLEIGPASGFLTAEMERRGGLVTSLELGGGSAWDIVPYSGWDPVSYLQKRAVLQDLLRLSFWRTHRALDLQARLFLGSVYRIPSDFGEFDVGTICSVLLHLRDPMAALAQVASRIRERIVLTEAVPGECLGGESLGLLDEANRSGDPTRLNAHLRGLDVEQLPDPGAFLLRPNPWTQEPKETWWSLTPRALTTLLGIHGFEIESTCLMALAHDARYLYHRPVERRTFHPTCTLVARRVKN